MLVPNVNMHIWQWLNWDKLNDKQKDHMRAALGMAERGR